jgi:UDPglucose 6-dehydrogenase
MLISVLGIGYLGATHAACMAVLGHEVVGIDAEPDKVAVLATGRAPFHEPGLDGLIAEGLASGRLSFDTRYERAADADVHFICVGTPQLRNHEAADLSYVWATINALAPLLTRPSVVAGKSTVPVGTAMRLRAVLQDRAPAGTDVSIAWNPEFLRESHAVGDSLRPDRLVFGVDSPQAEAALRDVYKSLLSDGVPVVCTDLATAELAKVAANTMLATRLSLINAFGEICEVSGGNVGDLTTVLGLDPRIGSSFLGPGVGFGGSCLPKDIRALMARADELGVSHAVGLLREVDQINLRRRTRAVDLAVGFLGGGPQGRRMTVLGAAFKPGSDDVRDSPALDVAAQLHAIGAEVTVCDPAAVDSARRIRPELSYCSDVFAACSGAEVILLLTEWPEFADVDPSALASVVSRRQVVDGRLALDRSRWQGAGWAYRALGIG